MYDQSKSFTISAVFSPKVTMHLSHSWSPGVIYMSTTINWTACKADHTPCVHPTIATVKQDGKWEQEEKAQGIFKNWQVSHNYHLKHLMTWERTGGWQSIQQSWPTGSILWQSTWKPRKQIIIKTDLFSKTLDIQLEEKWSRDYLLSN